jgi:uncharacterized protein YcfJ
MKPYMKQTALALALLGAVAGCATQPVGPSVAVMPAPGKPFEVFQAEDNACRQFAQNSVGKNANEAAAESELKSAAVGTAIGAAAGALIGGQQGSGQGAGVGLLAGTSMGANEAHYSAREVQRRYDIAYEQCMYAKGNQLPNGAQYQPRAVQQPVYSAPPPSPSGYSAPPPPPPSGR